MVANVSSTNVYSNNMYGQMYGQSMSNDYFGSQVFGNNSVNFQGNSTVFSSQPNDLASAIVQQHAGAANSNGQLTMQNYAMATQIANMYTSNIPSLFSNTSFMQNDIFAQQAVPNLYYCG